MANQTSSHTPGPWRFCKQSRLITDRQPDKTVVAELTLLEKQERNTNGYLIAAAPELLDACRTALALLDDSPLVNSETADLIRAAIAKAEGRAA